VKQSNEKFIRFFKALANQERIDIVKLLKDNTELNAQSIERRFYLEQSTTSHHLKMLKNAGVVKSRREGRNIFYSINYEILTAIWGEFSDIILK
jgi:DNA-binding transcriptional ArsR family regulator